jgi:hypothetical protein
MAKGRTIAVRITADTRGLVAGLTKAELNLTNFSKTARAAANVGGKFLATAAATAAASLAVLYSKTSQQIDINAKLADRLNLSTEALAGLQSQAEMSGISSESLNSNLERLTKTVGDAVQKGGAAADAFGRLGLSARELANMPADQQLGKIADAINGLGTAAQRTSAATSLFGKSGAEMLNMLADGSKGIDEARKRAESYGFALSRVDAAKVEAANDAWDEAQQVLQGIANKIAVKLAPIVEAVAEKFTDAAIDSQGFGDTVDKVFRGAVRVVGVFADGIHGIRIAIKGAELVIFSFEATILEVFRGVTHTIALSLDGWLGIFDLAIREINQKFGKNFATFDFNAENSPFVKAVDGLSESSINHIRELRGELHDMAMEELPSDKIQKFVNDVSAAATVAAEKVAAAKQKMAGGTGDVGMSDEDKQRLEKLKQDIATEEEIEFAAQENKLAGIQEFNQQLFATEAEKNATLERLEQEHQDRLLQMLRNGRVSQEAFSKLSWDRQASFITGTLVDITSAGARENKKMFELNKKAGIANALVSTYQGAAKALEWGFPMGPIFAAVIAAAGIAQVNAIRSQSFGGGGGGAAPSLAGGTSATPVSPVSGGKGGGQQVMRVEGLDPNATFSGRTMIDMINQAQKDGAKIVFSEQ